jgi:DNA primase
VPSISKQSIETLKAQLNLVDVVMPYVQLKQSGRSWSGLSPFTQEKTPSFYVHPDKGFFKCFSTGDGGDCYSFIMKVENLEFYEAVEFLSQKFNIPIQYDKGNQSPKELSLRKQVLEIHSFVTEWFHNYFIKSEEAEPVRLYWENQRRFTLDVAKEYKIGYAPTSSKALAQALEKKEL